VGKTLPPTTDSASGGRPERRTGGDPFYLRESARLLAGEGGLVATSPLPQGVRDVLRAGVDEDADLSGLHRGRLLRRRDRRAAVPVVPGPDDASPTATQRRAERVRRRPLLIGASIIRSVRAGDDVPAGTGELVAAGLELARSSG
jgi:hypothetical protein